MVRTEETSMRKSKKIDWRKGAGNVIIGMFIVLACFSVALIVMEHGNLFRQTTKTQMLSDAIADGATVWAQTPLSVDEAQLNTMAAKIAYANQYGSTSYSLYNPIITEDLSRDSFTDKLVTVHLDARTPLLIGRDGYADIKVGSQVRALTQLPNQVSLTDEEIQIIASALNQLPSDSAQYKAIINSLPMMGWIYSQQYRWVEGYRDCSSFVITSFRTDERNYGVSGYSQTIMEIARSNGWFNAWFPGFSSVDDLQPGDVLYWRGQWAVDEGRTSGLGHVGIYLGDGKIIHSSSSAGRVVITNIFGTSGGSSGLIGYSRQPI